MYMGIPVIIILILIIAGMISELRTRKKRIQLLIWDVRALDSILGARYLLPVYSEIEKKFLSANKLSNNKSPKSIKRLTERLQRYDDYYLNKNFPVRNDEANPNIFWGSDGIVTIHNIFATSFSSLGYEELKKYLKKTPTSDYKTLYEDEKEEY